ncbi:hypothetical protein AZF37_05520 [endosymbiont 'TC1' of Trimyema compressum]|uniref:amidohydrolase n=1 Tax=endosymbiont 'TC1' of Trimyema compressum TaxID=243899 RepID=UPI0007F09706|nr:amidohydrolase [endosymbiont 'TC1' of Trimyema compressum]AMP20703.1 hypothetical protein AZF37_05520 [endosymbiont 'TC1' of Trimyema compressum]
MGYLFKNIHIVSMDETKPEIFFGDVLVEDKIITKVGIDLPKVAHKVIEGKNRLLMPGLINTHTHVAMTLLRSYGDDRSLFGWLENMVWPMEEKMTKEDIKVGTELGIAEMLLSGTTTFLDMYAEMDQVALAVEETGIRGHLSKGMIFRDDEKIDQKNLEETEALIKEFHNKADGRIQFLVGPHAIYTNSKEFLEAQLAIAKKFNVGVHIHVSETRAEVDTALKNYGLSPVAYLESLGIFSVHPVIAAHCVHLVEGDLEILKKHNVSITHNPQSNLKLASGIASVKTYLDYGVNVGLGTDGASSNNNLDLLEELQYASFLQKGILEEPTALKAYEALKMATVDGAKALGIDHKVGMIKEGYEADLIVLDLNKPHFYPLQHNKISNLAYSAQSSDIILTMVQGKILMENRELKTIDLETLYSRVNESVQGLLKGH